VDATAGGVQFEDTFEPNTTYITFDVQDADCYVTFDQSAPTTTNGHKLYDTRSYTWHKNTALDAKFIRAGATDAILYLSEFVD
jgi:hypothetical protein